MSEVNDAQMRKGLVSLCVLAVLAEEEAYGYAIVQRRSRCCGTMRVIRAVTHRRRLPPSSAVLCALVPPPRAHTVLYYGVLSAHHKLRSAIVPRADEPEPAPKQLSLFIPRGQVELPAITTLLHAQLRDAAPSRLPWMKLLARVFRVDISVCSRCCGPMRVIRAVTTPQEIAAELRGARPPPRPSPVGQLLLFSPPPAAP